MSNLISSVMVKNSKKLFAIAMICAISGVSAIAMKEKSAEDAKAFVGLAYVAAENGASNEATAVIGVAGVVQGTIDGAVYGAVFGGAVGAAVGAVVGL